MTKLIYIDESGNSDLKSGKNGASNFYVITAIIVDREKLAEQKAILARIILKVVGTGELKSSKVGNKHQRRLKILSDLIPLDFHVYSLVVNKDLLITTGGLRFKKSFVKFINGMVCGKLFTSFKSINIIADSQGSKEFQQSLGEYIQTKKSESILFDDSSYESKSSKDEHFIQVADIIAGTIAKIQQKTISNCLASQFLETIEGKFLLLEYWPPFRKSVIGSVVTVDEDGAKYWNDELIKRYSVDMALDYISNNPSYGDSEVEIRIAALKYLLYQVQPSGKNAFVVSDQIIRYVESETGETLSKHGLSSRVISKLRDDGVIISSGEYGYKIPCTVSDILEYVKTTDTKVVPMLKRIKKTSDTIKFMTQGKVDIIAAGSGDVFQKIISVI